MQKRKIKHEKREGKADPFEVMSRSFESIVFQRIVDQSIKESEQDSERLDSTDGKITDAFKGILEGIEKDIEIISGLSNNTKIFLKILSKFIMPILMSGRFNALKKIIVKLAVETTLKAWPEQN